MIPATRVSLRRAATMAALALAPLASAWAQSSNTIYGRIDLGVRYMKDVKMPELPAWRIDDSSRGRIGFQGVEDLGDGLAAIYQLEHRLFADTGEQDGDRMWKDKSWVGLTQRGVGSVRFGRMSSPVNERGVAGRFEAFGGDSLAGMGTRGAAQNEKWDNAVMLQTAYFGGFSVAAGYAMGEGTKQKDAYGLQAEYKGERLIVSLAWQRDTRAATATRSADDWQTAALSATYDWGVFELYGIAARSWDLGASNAGRAATYTVGASMPAGPGEVRLSYQASNQRLFNGSDRSADAQRRRGSLGYYYPLSRLTSLNFSLLHDRYRTATGREMGSGGEVALRKNF